MKFISEVLCFLSEDKEEKDDEGENKTHLKIGNHDDFEQSKGAAWLEQQDRFDSSEVMS